MCFTVDATIRNQGMEFSHKEVDSFLTFSTHARVLLLSNAALLFNPF